MLQNRGERHIHYPDKPTFEFDREVASIFPDMATRSIPLYAEVHRLHASLMLSLYPERDDALCVADVGASRGQFYAELCNQLHDRHPSGYILPTYTAIETSSDMLQLLIKDHPRARALLADVGSPLPDLPHEQNAIVMLYVLQFIKDRTLRQLYIDWAYDSLKPGGMLVFGSKILPPEPARELFTGEYMLFRQRNGYSLEEIKAKTLALAGAMWELEERFFHDMAYSAGFRQVYQTTRWLQFATWVAVK